MTRWLSRNWPLGVLLLFVPAYLLCQPPGRAEPRGQGETEERLRQAQEQIAQLEKKLAKVCQILSSRDAEFAETRQEMAGLRKEVAVHDGFWRQMRQGVIGKPERRNKNVEYTAPSDGWVVVYTGGNAPPEWELIVDGYCMSRFTARYTSGMTPVARGQKWRVRTVNDPNPADPAGKHDLAGAYPFWIPLTVPAAPGAAVNRRSAVGPARNVDTVGCFHLRQRAFTSLRRA
jgi:hypothetical protein